MTRHCRRTIAAALGSEGSKRSLDSLSPGKGRRLVPSNALLMSSTRSRRVGGFTLLELVVVVLILSFLAFAASGFVSTAVLRSEGRPAEELTLVALLLRLAGLAVLLFGGGFWYLVELREPGRLDTFRLGHFLLLACTYSLFFAVFAVLGAHEVPAWLSVGIAAAVSYPLVVLHVATIVDLRFALTSALPLAVATTGIVVNGVYGDTVKAYVWLGIVCVVIAHLTLTYPVLARGQEARRSALDHQLAQAADELSAAAASGRTAIADANALLALHDPVEHAALRKWVEQRSGTIDRVLGEYERLSSLRETALGAPTRIERRAARGHGMLLAQRLRSRLPHARAELLEATGALAAQRGKRTPQRVADEALGGDHCVACGQPCGAGAHFCPACGTPCAEVRRCRRCEHVLRLPLHLLVPDDAEQPRATHCVACGERHG